jgi:hypothetical protein
MWPLWFSLGLVGWAVVFWLAVMWLRDGPPAPPQPRPTAWPFSRS